jgi:diguanylate cyclase (GGDEF)-like protein
VSRQGGDEFVVVLQDVASKEGIEVVANRILAAVAGVHVLGEHQVSITASVGVGRYPEDGTDAETLMMRADAALYEAKASGRGCFCFFEAAEGQRMQKEVCG